MTGYWDIHNHILPGVDDGSGCMRETMEMLEEEYRQGVRHIVFTPHYRRDMFAIPREEIQTVYARVCEMAADRFPEMEFYLGCEYYIHSDASVERLRGNPKYYMAGSRTVLMEFAYEASYAWIMQTVSEVRQMGLQPVLAHAERYECLYKGRDRVAELKTQGAYIQINCESILGKCGRKAKHFCMKLLKEDQVDLMDLFGYTFKPVAEYIMPGEFVWNRKEHGWESDKKNGGVSVRVEFMVDTDISKDKKLMDVMPVSDLKDELNLEESGNIMADFSIFQNEAIRNYEKTRLGIQGAVEHN